MGPPAMLARAYPPSTVLQGHELPKARVGHCWQACLLQASSQSQGGSKSHRFNNRNFSPSPGHWLWLPENHHYGCTDAAQRSQI